MHELTAPIPGWSSSAGTKGMVHTPPSMFILTVYKNTKYLDRRIPRQRRIMADGHMPHIDRSRREVTPSGFQSSTNANNLPYTRLHGVRHLFNRMRPSTDTEKKRSRLARRTPEVTDVPLGNATVGDYIPGGEDGVRPYSLFFCLGWFQKNEKTPDPPRKRRKTRLNVPIPTTRVRLAQQEYIELTPMASQSQSEAGPSCTARGARHREAQLRSPSYGTVHATFTLVSHDSSAF
ncbi:hypothetical protein M405DRAFT_842973 [Rhizopogon salebrosus TDB-379]|nr:hypothetical protein M405DRAFT_842973 [Rhizopogon salebrosus TDB-379]